MSARIRVLIADDHQMFIDGIKSLLMDVPDIVVVAEALNGLKALSQLSATHIDVALMDINMPEMNGLETTREIVQRFSHVQVLMLTMHNRPHYIRQFIALGARGYILKNTGKAELIAAIRTVAKGQPYYSQAVTQTLVNSMQQAEGQVRLSPREQQILELIVAEVKTKEIALQLNIGVETVNTHRKNLLRKLGVDNTAGLVREAITRGMVDLSDYER